MNEDAKPDPEDTWTRKDIGLGLLFLATGALIVCLAVLAARNGFPIAFLASAWLLGPILVLLGINSVVRSLLARPDDAAG